MPPRKAKSPTPSATASPATGRTPRSTRKSSASAAQQQQSTTTTTTTTTPSRAKAPVFAVRDGRPSLPTQHLNDMLHSRAKVYPVKEQTLTLEQPNPPERIIIYRVKVPTPKGISGHLIRRTDTDAVSASSLFRAAFPYASQEAEAAEMAHVAKSYDTVKAGREDEADGAGRLTGTWVPLTDARDLSAQYGLTRFAAELFKYESENPIPVSPRLAKQLSGVAESEIPLSSEPEINDSPQPARTPKRTRLRSPRATAQPSPLPDVGAAVTVDQSAPEQDVQSVTVKQDVVTDQATGTSTETNTVEVSAPAQSSAEDQIAESKKLVEKLKADKLLADAEASSAAAESDDLAGKKRSRDTIEQEETEAEQALPVPTRPSKRSWFGRSRAAPVPGEVDHAEGASGTTGKRIFAFAGLAVVGAATAAAPYIFG